MPRGRRSAPLRDRDARPVDHRRLNAGDASASWAVLRWLRWRARQAATLHPGRPVVGHNRHWFVIRRVVGVGAVRQLGHASEELALPHRGSGVPLPCRSCCEFGLAKAFVDESTKAQAGGIHYDASLHGCCDECAEKRQPTYLITLGSGMTSIQTTQNDESQFRKEKGSCYVISPHSTYLEVAVPKLA